MGLSPGRPLKMGGGIFTQGGGAGPPGTGAGNLAAAACIAATICTNKAALEGGVSGGPSGHAGPTGPTGPLGPAGPSGGGGGGSGGTGPSLPGPPPLPLDGPGAAIMNTHCNGRSNLTLLINNGPLHPLCKHPGHLHHPGKL